MKILCKESNMYILFKCFLYLLGAGATISIFILASDTQNFTAKTAYGLLTDPLKKCKEMYTRPKKCHKTDLTVEWFTIISVASQHKIRQNDFGLFLD